MSRPADPGTVAITTAAWVGLIGWLLWQELGIVSWPGGTWWFRIPGTILLSFVLLLSVLDVISGEMTVRRWAASVLIFAGFGILFLICGIFEPDWMHLSRWMMIPAAGFYFFAAFMSAMQARDTF